MCINCKCCLFTLYKKVRYLKFFQQPIKEICDVKLNLMINLEEGRIGFEAIGNIYPIAENIVREDVVIANVPCSWFIPENTPENDIVIYIHGGAFIFGSVKSHAALVSNIATKVRRKILMIDYRLAPEYPFPAGINDCAAVIETIQKQNPLICFGFFADSAGGNLAMATQLQLEKTSGHKSQYTILISPWVDLECKNESYERNKMTDGILIRQYLIEAAHMYAPGHKLSDPALSTVNSDFHDLAPVLILCGTNEILEDDSVHLHKKLTDCGVQSELKLFKGEPHVWPFLDINKETSQMALNNMAHFVAMHSHKEH
jgi:acetyl esterase/lipase